MMEAPEKQKKDKELCIRLIRKHLRLDDPEVIESAYEDGAKMTFPYFAERQFQVALDLMGKSLEQVVELPYKTVVDNSLLDEIARSGSSR